MPDQDLVPTRRPSVHFEILDDEAVVYDRQGKRAVYLSETATLIWQMCDGDRTIDEIRMILSVQYPESASRIAGDVNEAIEHMSAERIIVLKNPGAEPSEVSSPT